ncbi:hypothetical protein CEXT_155631 [Caerostris extrusa]|uniref:Uncharacterized protein n=1 Tax=Caerostris extrusa TaxID=172846 RepID=A0AAV4MPU8_CAEEX|nr:hypothetical protein CEXT_155631 [Caerostris extrusa]
MIISASSMQDDCDLNSSDVISVALTASEIRRPSGIMTTSLKSAGPDGRVTSVLALVFGSKVILRYYFFPLRGHLTLLCSWLKDIKQSVIL